MIKQLQPILLNILLKNLKNLNILLKIRKFEYTVEYTVEKFEKMVLILYGPYNILWSI